MYPDQWAPGFAGIVVGLAVVLALLALLAVFHRPIITWLLVRLPAARRRVATTLQEDLLEATARREEADVAEENPPPPM